MTDPYAQVYDHVRNRAHAHGFDTRTMNDAHFKLLVRLTIESIGMEADYEVADDSEADAYPPPCSNPDTNGRHTWVEGAADRGDEGPIRCSWCGADGDA